MDKSKKMRICFFIGGLTVGGIGRVYLNLIKELVKYDNVAIDLFLLSGKGEFMEEVPKDVRVYIAKRGTFDRFYRFIKYIIKEKPDISLSARQRQDIINIIGCLFSLGGTKPLITVHTNLTVQTKKSSNAQNIYPIISKFLYKIPKKFIAVSEGVKEDFCDRTGVNKHKVKVIHNPVYVPYDGREPSVIPQKFKELMRSKEEFIVSAGRMVEQKDMFNLINAFSIVKKSKSLKLVILGDGPLRSKIERLIKKLNLIDDILLLGYVDTPQFYMNLASLYVMSSKWEGLPTVLIEALGVGTPIVSTDCPNGPFEILRGGKCGKLVPIDNSEKLATGIIEMLRNPVDSNMLIQRAADFSIPKITQEYYDYFEK